MKYLSSFIIIAVLVLFASCDKDTFETKPKLTFKSVSSDVVYTGQRFTITVEYTDAEGDVTDSIYLIQQVLNQSHRGDPDYEFTRIFYKIPDFPASRKGEITAHFVLNTQAGPNETAVPAFSPVAPNEDDTVVYHIHVVDSEKNRSDTVTTSQIIYIRP